MFVLSTTASIFLLTMSYKRKSFLVAKAVCAALAVYCGKTLSYYSHVRWEFRSASVLKWDLSVVFAFISILVYGFFPSELTSSFASGFLSWFFVSSRCRNKMNKERTVFSVTSCRGDERIPTCNITTKRECVTNTRLELLLPVLQFSLVSSPRHPNIYYLTSKFS